MKTVTLESAKNACLLAAILLFASMMACDEPKTESAAAPEAAASVAQAPPPAPSPTVPAPPPAPTFAKRHAADCKAHPAAVDFGDDVALEKEVRRKLGKDKGPLAPSDLAQIK